MNKRMAGLAALALLGGWLTAAPALADPPPWAPAHGYRAKQYRYVYYPEYEVYYAPETRLWFWLDGGRWRFGATLPGYLPLVGVPGVSIILGSERPYYEHRVVIEHYGRGDRYRGERYEWHGRDRDREVYRERNRDERRWHEGDRGDRGDHGGRGDRGDRGDRDEGRGRHGRD